MYPTKTDNIVAYAKGPAGPAGPINQGDIDDLIGGAPEDGDTLKKLYDLIAARAPIDGAELTNAEAPTQTPGNDSNLVASTAFVQQELTNAVGAALATVDESYARQTEIPQPADATPLRAKAVGDVGVATQFAREDHIHPGREVLTASRTYYVRKDGSDSNDGLADSVSGAFLTIQKALDTAYALDFSIYNITIQVRAGTYAERLTLKEYVGAGFLSITGDPAAPSNVVISATSGACFSGAGHRLTALNGFKLQTTTSGEGIKLSAGARLTYQNIDFGTIVNSQVYIEGGATAQLIGPCTISGGATSHVFASAGAYLNISGRTITLTGTPAFSGAFAIVDSPAFILAAGNTFSGAATGKRFDATLNGVINTSGGGANYFPGNAAGTNPTGLYA